MSNILNFPKRPQPPNTIEVQFDLGSWALAYFKDSKFKSRLRFDSREEVETEALRLAERGMRWRMGDNGSIYVAPDSNGGGCWAVVHRSGSADKVLNRHFSINQATQHAVRAARDFGAVLTLNGPYADRNGAA